MTFHERLLSSGWKVWHDTYPVETSNMYYQRDFDHIRIVDNKITVSTDSWDVVIDEELADIIAQFYNERRA